MGDTKKTSGLVLGRFMPVHKGHVYLIEFARHFVDELTLAVVNFQAGPFPGELRRKWLRELFPDIRVLPVRSLTTSGWQPDSQLYDLWARSLLKRLPSPPDYLFASEAYGWKLAETLGARFVPVDPQRSIVPASSAAIRSDPMQNWEFLPNCVRPHFLRRICIFGPESTGKSTLARNLADHFRTVAVPEYARTHIGARKDHLDPDDIPVFAFGQIASEDALARLANRVMFCDTDPITTSIWSDWLYGSCPESVKRLAEERSYDLYLLTDVDVPWIEDPQRYLPTERKSFFDRCQRELESRKRPYVVISGDWDKRLADAVAATEQIIKLPAGPLLSAQQRLAGQDPALAGRQFQPALAALNFSSPYSSHCEQPSALVDSNHEHAQQHEPAEQRIVGSGHSTGGHSRPNNSTVVPLESGGSG